MINVDDEQNETSKMFGFSIDDLLSSSRLAHLVRARQIAIHVCRNHMVLSYPAIAKAFNRNDHTTVMHAVGKIDELV